MAKDSKKIVVIGAGVIGLTSALLIQESLSLKKENYEVIIAAHEFPHPHTTKTSVDYASMWAGAHLRPIPASTPQLEREASWFRKTAARFRSQFPQEPWLGILPLRGVEYLAVPSEAYQNLVRSEDTFTKETALENLRVLDEKELPDGVALGFEYDTFCVNAPVYCMALLRKFLLRGGKTVNRNLKSEWEAFSLESNVRLVVNASGMGFGDSKSFPTRGQICLVSNPFDKTITRQHKDGTWSFVIPRCLDGGTVIGGTKDVNDWNSEPSLATREELFRKAVETFPEIKNSAGRIDVITDVVGRRPTRVDGMRIEAEVRQEGGGTRSVVHAYGAGGRGYELSWGIAGDVAELVGRVLWEQSKPVSRL